MSIEFENPLTAGTVLVREQIQSQNYIPGSAGWVIKANGDAEFNSVVIRGGTVVSGVALYYDGTPAAGNLVMSLAATSGVDEFGNAYGRGMTVYNPSAGSSIQVDAGGGASNINLVPPDVTGVTWDDGNVSVGTGSRLGTDTPFIALSAPYDNDLASKAEITLFGNPSVSNGDVTNEIFMATFRVHVTGDHNVVGSAEAGNRDRGTGSAVMVAQASVDVAVSFNKTFPNTPRVTALLRGNPTLPATSSSLIIRAFNISTTGCTIRVNDVNATNRTLTHAFDWHAESD